MISIANMLSFKTNKHKKSVKTFQSNRKLQAVKDKQFHEKLFHLFIPSKMYKFQALLCCYCSQIRQSVCIFLFNSKCSLILDKKYLFKKKLNKTSCVQEGYQNLTLFIVFIIYCCCRISLLVLLVSFLEKQL